MSIFWLTLGFLSQFMFALRFAIQWIATEKKKTVHVPEAFWYFSILGSIGLLIYSIHRKDPVFIVGQLFGFVVYARNIYFIRRNRPS